MKIRTVPADRVDAELSEDPRLVAFVANGAAHLVEGARDVRAARVALHAHDPEFSAVAVDVRTRATPYPPPPVRQAG